jgi:hypothetical protein
LPLPEQDIIKEYSNYSNGYSSIHNQTQIQTNTSKQNTGYLSTKRTTKDNQKQAMPYPAFGMIIHNFAIQSLKEPFQTFRKPYSLLKKSLLNASAKRGA